MLFGSKEGTDLCAVPADIFRRAPPDSARATVLTDNDVLRVLLDAWGTAATADCLDLGCRAGIRTAADLSELTQVISFRLRCNAQSSRRDAVLELHSRHRKMCSRFALCFQRKATVFEAQIDRDLICAQFRERSDLLR